MDMKNLVLNGTMLKNSLILIWLMANLFLIKFMTLTILFWSKNESTILDDTILVASLIKKLPPSWSCFQRILKQKPKNFSFDKLLFCLQIEDKYCETLRTLSNGF